MENRMEIKIGNKMGNKIKNNVKQVPIDLISVSDYHREVRDLPSLIESIKQVGIICPVIVTEEYRLVAGHRRLKACEALGQKTIPANVLSLDENEAEALAFHEQFFGIGLSNEELNELLERPATQAALESYKKQKDRSIA